MPKRPAIEIFHLRRVRDKPRAVALLVEHAGLSADASLASIHQAVGGGKPSVSLPAKDAVSGDERARRLIVALAGTGFIARRARVDGFDPGEHAQQVMTAVLPGCPPALADAVGALLLAGDWAQALELGVQHLRRHRPADDPDRLLLEAAAIDTGLVRGVPGRV